MDQIVSIKFGSHLYGTSTPASDLDIKGVYVPDGRSILLGRVKPVISTSRQKGVREKNTADDVDTEIYSVAKFLELLGQGQTVAMDMLFAPMSAMLSEPSPLWREIWDARHHLLSRQASSFLGYCRQQANKYGIKGSRVAAARSALAMLGAAIEAHGTTAKLGDAAHVIDAFVAGTEHSSLIDHPMPGDRMIRHLEVCGRKMPFTASIKSAVEVMDRLVTEYGQRALQAEKQEGVDWKALSHAVRVGTEALELLATSHVTFPLSNAAHVLAIKLGTIPYRTVAEEIEQLLVEVEEAAPRSSLPEHPDHGVMDAIIERAHRRAVERSAP